VDVTKEIRRITGSGIDYVITTTGRADMLDHAVDSLAPMGQVGLVAGGGPDATVGASKLGLGMSVRGIVQGDSIPQLFIPTLIQLFQSGRFPIDRLVHFHEFDDINAAFAAAARGDVIKPVIRIADSGDENRSRTNGR
jgi:aryl-alcohol dehydrogenase